MAQYGIGVLVFLLVAQAQAQVTPVRFQFPTLGTVAVNGSSATGNCPGVTLNRDGTSNCNSPTSSVLFDRNTPTLSGLDGNTWASQFFTLYQPNFAPISFDMDFYFSSNIELVNSVEVTLFNCPQWGLGAESITVQHYQSFSNFDRYNDIGEVHPTVLSCSSLLRVCIPITFLQVVDFNYIRLHFNLFTGSQQSVPIAEVAFYSVQGGSGRPCPAFTEIPSNIPPNSPSNPTSTEQVGQSAATDETAIQVDFKDSSPILSLLAVVIVIMILQTVFVVVLVAALAMAFRYYKNNHKQPFEGDNNTM